MSDKLGETRCLLLFQLVSYHTVLFFPIHVERWYAKSFKTFQTLPCYAASKFFLKNWESPRIPIYPSNHLKFDVQCQLCVSRMQENIAVRFHDMCNMWVLQDTSQPLACENPAHLVSHGTDISLVMFSCQLVLDCFPLHSNIHIG